MPKPRIGLKHQLLKSRARASASSVLANALLIPVAFKPIDSQALEALNDWGDDVHFSWEEVPNWKAKEPWSFDVSIWCGPQLCGLCFANPNQSRLRTRIVRLEGKPDSRHPLKNRIAALAMFAVEQYARQVGSQWLEIHLVNAMPKPRIGLKHQLLKSRARAGASGWKFRSRLREP